MAKRRMIKISIAVCVFVVVFSAYFLFFFAPRSVQSFGSLKLGDLAPLKVGDGAVIAPYSTIRESRFYVYAVQKGASFCAFEDCGMSGVLVDCMEGWLSADSAMPSIADYGLIEEDVEAGRASIIIVADRNQRIVGIYPNYIIQNIPYILKNHRDLSDRFDFCYDIQMPKRWRF